jgi:hypothetical protein
MPFEPGCEPETSICLICKRLIGATEKRSLAEAEVEPVCIPRLPFHKPN